MLSGVFYIEDICKHYICGDLMKKKILVLYGLDEESKRRLIELAGALYEVMFYSSEWSWAKYCYELQEASIIIGEPKSEEPSLL